MRRIVLLILSTIAIFPVSCSISDGDVDINSGIEPDCCVPASATRGLDKSEFVVSEADIDCYISFKEKISKREITVKSIEPVRSGNEAVAYAINYNDCWELVSGDKRTPIVLASGKGAFSLKTDNESFNAWISRICDCVNSLSRMEQLKDIHRKNITHWKLITNDQEYLKSLASETRSLNSTRYEIIQIDTVDVSEYTNHLVTTHWGQRAPFNMYCPLKSNSDTDRVSAGCVAIAGAQVLNYLHGEFDIPETAPTVATCSGHAPNSYTMSQSGFSSSAWDGIENGDSTIMAALVAYVGKNSLTYYSDNGSYATLENLMDYVLYPSGWEYAVLDDYCDDYEDIIYELLRYDYPSIIGASMSSPIDPNFTNSHAFIVDRYMNEMTDYYYTINIIEGGQVVGSLDHVERTEPIRYFGMNWGWYGLYDDIWCLATAPWSCAGYDFSPVQIITFNEF
ncbi:MAG: C10 family peptidase [Bacteroidales bacterium]|nr:C10 family peptidase [Bacteroidales bacterium]